MRAPRARACSSDSRISTPAPSPSTKPLRATSQGRETAVGSPPSGPLAVFESAIMFANAAIGSGWIAASVPPATTTSARPSRIWSSPRAIASLPEAHAETGVMTAARAPTYRLMFAAGALGISIGTASGDTRRGPLVIRLSYPSRSVVTPPMPEAIATPSRSRSRSAPSRPACFQASIAATIANCELRSRRRALTRSSTSVGSTAIRPAILTGISSAQSSVRNRTPERPLTRASQVLGTSPPTGGVGPRPVTTTRVEDMLVLAGVRRTRLRSGLGPLDERDGVTDGLEVLHLVVGDRDAELLLGGDDHLDHGQRVHVEVVDERLVELHVVGVDAGDLVDDLGEVGADLFGGGHLAVPSLCGFPSGGTGLGGSQGTVTTCAAYARPAPKAMSSAVSPLLASPSSIIRSRASGMDAAEVLPCSAMSRAILTRSGSFIVRA